MTSVHPPAGKGCNLAAVVERIPAHCFWEITDACNLRCIHCEADSGRADPGELSPSEALALVDELAACGCERVCLTGGEPLVRRDWPAIARRFVERGVDVTVISNGLGVDDEAVRTMRAVGATGLSVSVDGRQAVHDAIRIGARARDGSVYERALAAIARGKAAGLKVAVITQIHRHNLDDLPMLHDLFATLGVDAWQLQICMPLGRLIRFREKYLLEPRQLPELVAKIEDFIRAGQVPILVADNIGYYGRSEPLLRSSMKPQPMFWAGCMAGCRVVGIRSNGDVKGCPSHPESFVVGNVRVTPFAEIWGDASHFAYNTAFDSRLLEGRCAVCAYRELCRAGCTSMAFAVTGTIYDNPFCLQRATPPEADRRRPAALRVLDPTPEGTR
jgi:radical SAM protein with 4Fe4S-binding SPASM domain